MGVKLTRNGYEKLRKELNYLSTTKRKEIVKAIEHARSHGDLRENAEYDTAKNEQVLVEKRIAELGEMLSSATILDEDIDATKVYLGARVTIQDITRKKELQYMIVNKEEAHLREGKISIESPVGKALLGKSTGDVVEITIPAGTLKYKIVKIER